MLGGIGEMWGRYGVMGPSCSSVLTLRIAAKPTSLGLGLGLVLGLVLVFGLALGLALALGLG